MKTSMGPTEWDGRTCAGWLDTVESLARVGAFEFDIEGDSGWVSPRFLEIHGIDEGSDAAARLGTPEGYAPLVHPEDREALMALSAALVDGGDPIGDVTWRIVRPDGEVRWVRARSKVLPAADGKGPRVVGTVQDVGDQEASEAELGLMLHAGGVLEQWADLGPDRMEQLIAAVATPMRATAGILWTANADRRTLRPHAWWVGDRERAEEFKAAIQFSVLRSGEGLPGKAWATGEVLALATVLRSDPHVAAPGLPDWPGRLMIPIGTPDSPLAVLGLHFEAEPRLTVRMTAALEALSGRLADFFTRHRVDLGRSPVTDREREILQLAADGNTIAAMAQRLMLSESTIKTHLEHVHSKLGVNSRPAAVARALRTGLIT